MMTQPGRWASLAAWLETAAMPSITGLAVGASSGLSMGGTAGWVFGVASSLVAILLGIVLAEKERRQTRPQRPATHPTES
jgi:hypothetical protein